MVWLWLNRPARRLPSAKRIWMLVTGALLSIFNCSAALKLRNIIYQLCRIWCCLAETNSVSLSSLLVVLVDDGTVDVATESVTFGVGLPNVWPLPANGLTFGATGLYSSCRWSSKFTWTTLPSRCRLRSSGGNSLETIQFSISEHVHNLVLTSGFTLWWHNLRILYSVCPRTIVVRHR